MLLDRVPRARLATDPTRCGRSHRDQGVAVRYFTECTTARAEALRMPRRCAALLVVRPSFSLAVDAAVRHAFTFRAPQDPPAGLLAVATEEHLLLWRRLLTCCWCVVLRQAADGDLDSGYVYRGLLLHGPPRRWRLVQSFGQPRCRRCITTFVRSILVLVACGLRGRRPRDRVRH